MERVEFVEFCSGGILLLLTSRAVRCGSGEPVRVYDLPGPESPGGGEGPVRGAAGQNGVGCALVPRLRRYEG
eukprot:3771953-Pyramimonas_sp.AAC.1